MRISRTTLAGALSCVPLLLWSPVSSAQETEGFHFGSYGRTRIATDLRGGGPQYSNIAAYGSRLDAAPYLELELRNTQYPDEKNKDLRVRVVSTLAFAGDPFHYTGQWESHIALRNMFVDVQGLGHKGLTLWTGARMYRGDDIYLLDFWPLDNLNTVGAGAILDVGSGTRLQAHAGTNRLLGSDFQYQARLVPSANDFGTNLAVTLDRPRTIASAKVTQFFNGFNAAEGFKASVYAEGHFLPSGTRESSENTVRPSDKLPADNGFVVGAQATGYGFGDRYGHAHLFARYARGVAAFGELATPSLLDAAKKADASEFVVALAGNYEINRFGVMWGAYARMFDASLGAEYSANKYWEGTILARPQVYVSEHVGIGAEVGYQFKNRKILDDTGKHNVPSAFRVSLLPIISPAGWGGYHRPIIYGVYTATIRNKAAQGMYPVEDPRSDRSTEHYLGLHSEWWFNSSSYP
ncbi:MAG: carbohydrate porin [Polyangiaceae bacterium]|nr:carbohydrate porin [Polyangiaceae bacterium]